MTTQKFIEGHEGRRNKPYKDTAEPPKTTLGVGWNMDANPLPDDIQEYLNANGEITDEMVDRLFSISLDRATVGCKDLFPDFDNFSDNRKMALIDFTFEMGDRRPWPPRWQWVSAGNAAGPHQSCGPPPRARG